MTLRKMTLQVGFGAAVFNIIGGIAYLVILSIMIATPTPMSDPDAPPLVAASVLMLVGPLGLIPLWVAIHMSTTEDKKVFSLVSLIFVTLFSAATSINRWVHLTIVREASSLDIIPGLEWFTPYGEHSIMFAIEMLAYGWFLGFASLSIAPIFHERTTRLEGGLFWVLLICGILCLLGGIGQLLVIRSILIFMMSMTGWSLGLGLANILFAVWFNRLRKNVMA
jgi:hypothetical protein